jgi:hypothetical protein
VPYIPDIQLAENELKRDPQRSDAVIAEQTKVSSATVKSARSKLVESQEIPDHRERVGKDGKRHRITDKQRHRQNEQRFEADVEKALSFAEKCPLLKATSHSDDIKKRHIDKCEEVAEAWIELGQKLALKKKAKDQERTKETRIGL